MKRKLEEESLSKRFKGDEDQNCSPMDKIKFSTTPLWNVPYLDQVRDSNSLLLGNIKPLLYYSIILLLAAAQAERNEIHSDENWPADHQREQSINELGEFTEKAISRFAL